MNTISEQAVGNRRRRRIHSDEFKAAVVASCLQPGISMAAVAMANGINANLLRRWVHEAEMHGDADQAPRVRLVVAPS
ncbi:MAG: transposase [Rhodoferax sp.]|uniref:transposase n=1 Tax=Rhodoferax sp. TaxID=50421 RepID=UPI003265FA83